MTDTVSVQIVGDASKLESAIRRADSSFDHLGKSARRLQGLLAGALDGREVARGVGVAVKAYADYDAALRRIGVTAEATTKRLDALGTSSRKAGVQSSAEATTATKATNDLAKAGLAATEVALGLVTAHRDLSGSHGFAATAAGVETLRAQFDKLPASARRAGAAASAAHAAAGGAAGQAGRRAAAATTLVPRGMLGATGMAALQTQPMTTAEVGGRVLDAQRGQSAASRAAARARHALAAAEAAEATAARAAIGARAVPRTPATRGVVDAAESKLAAARTTTATARRAAATAGTGATEARKRLASARAVQALAASPGPLEAPTAPASARARAQGAARAGVGKVGGLVRRGGKAGAIGAVAGGATALLSGGSVAANAVAGAEMGAVAGPVGAAAGLVVGAGVTALVNHFKSAGAKRTAAAARSYAQQVTGATASAMASGLRAAPAQRLGKANTTLAEGRKAVAEYRSGFRELQDGNPGRGFQLQRAGTERAKAAGLDINALLKGSSNAYRKAGAEAVAAFSAGLRTGGKTATATGLMNQFKAGLGSAPRSAQQAGATSMVRFAQSLEKSGNAPKGTVDRLIRALGRQYDGLTPKIGSAAISSGKALSRALNDQKSVQSANRTAGRIADAFKNSLGNMPRIAVRSLPGAVATLRTQMDRLRKVAADSNVPASLRRQASAALPGLAAEYRRTLTRMAKDMGMSEKDAGSWARNVSRAALRAKDGGVNVGTLRSAVRKLNDTMGTSKDSADILARAFQDLGADAETAKRRAAEALKTPRPPRSPLDTSFPTPFKPTPPKEKAPKYPKGSIAERVHRERRNERRTGGLIRRFQDGGFVPALVSSGEEIEYGGRSMIVPGARVAADNVPMMLPVGATVWTDHGQALRAAGVPDAQALAQQLPHFREGGAVPRFAKGGILEAAKAGRAAGWSGAQLVTGVAIAGPESGYRNTARLVTSAEDSRGMWQINTKAHTWARGMDLTNPYVAARAAERVRRSSGWGAWTGYTGPDGRGSDGAWRSFVGQARQAVIASRGSTSTSDGGRTAVSAVADRTYTVPVTLRASRTRARDAMSEALQAGLERGGSWTRADVAAYGNPYLRTLRQTLDDARASFTRQVTVNGAAGRAGRAGATSSRGGSVGGSGTLRWPTGSHVVTSGFGGRRAPRGGASTNHDGIDIGVPTGTPVYAAARGRVTRAGLNGGYGTYVELQHRAGVTSFYGHLSKILARAGATVNAGARIALSGNTGTSTGPHLHFGVHRGGQRIDPRTLLGQAFRGGGVVRRFGAGGTAGASISTAPGPPTGRTGRALDSVLRSTSDASLARLDRQLAGLATSRLDALRRYLAERTDAGGDAKANARVKAALAQVSEQIGFRVARSAQRISTRLEAATTIVDTVGSSLASGGIDPDSVQGRTATIDANRRAAKKASSAQTQAGRDLDRAQRNTEGLNPEARKAAVAAAQEQLTAATTAVKGFQEAAIVAQIDLERNRPKLEAAARDEQIGLRSAQALLTGGLDDDRQAIADRQSEASRQYAEASSRGDVAWMTQAAQDLASAAGDLKAFDESQREATFDFDAAMAALTEDDGKDDVAVSQRRAEDAQKRLDAALARGEEGRADATKAATDLKQWRDAVTDNTKALADQQAASELLTDLMKQTSEQQQKILAGTAAGTPALASALWAFAAGGIGSSVVRAAGTPGYPGGGARY